MYVPKGTKLTTSSGRVVAIAREPLLVDDSLGPGCVAIEVRVRGPASLTPTSARVSACAPKGTQLEKVESLPFDGALWGQQVKAMEERIRAEERNQKSPRKKR